MASNSFYPSILVDLTKGIAKEIKYTDYNDFKWYRDATEEAKFKNTYKSLCSQRLDYKSSRTGV